MNSKQKKLYFVNAFMKGDEIYPDLFQNIYYGSSMNKIFAEI